MSEITIECEFCGGTGIQYEFMDDTHIPSQVACEHCLEKHAQAYRIEQVAKICREQDYQIAHIHPYKGGAAEMYRVYMVSQRGVTQKTLESRFADTPLISTGFGNDRVGVYVTVMFRD